MTSIARAVLRFCLLMWTIAQALAQFAYLLSRSRRGVSDKRRAEWLHHWCEIGLRRLGVDYSHCEPIHRDGLIVCNHLSYLDILVFSAIAPCVFVSKSEVRSWPLLGLMSRLAGTIFVVRARSTSTFRANQEIEDVLRNGLRVVLFPEGTSTDGSSVLRFHSSLFEPAVRAQKAITPAHISYEIEGGSVANDVCYWGDMTLAPHLMKLLSRRKVACHVRFSEQSQVYTARKEAASASWAEVVTLHNRASTDARPELTLHL